MPGHGLAHARVRLQRGLDGSPLFNPPAKGEVAGPRRLKERRRFHAEAGKILLPRRDLVLGDAAHEVGLHVLGLGLRGVVHVAADVEVTVVGLDDLGFVHQAAVLGDLALVGEDKVDLLDVLGAQLVLVLALGVLAVGVDEEHLVTQGVRLVLVAHQHAGRDARAVEQALGQADDRLYTVSLDKDLADELLLAAAEEHAVGHDGGHVAAGLEAGQHVLDKHQVGLLAGLWTPLAEAAGELHIGAAVVLGEGRVGQHPVELADPAIVQKQWVLQGVAVLDGEARDVVEDHVHVADGPHRAVGVLAVERQVVRVLALLLHILVRLDQEAPRTRGGIVDGVARLGLGELHQEANHLARGIELAALLARAVREELDQVLVSRAQQVRELKVVVHQHESRLVEVVQQVLPLLVGDLGLALDRVEVDVVLQHPGQGVVLVLDGGDGLVEHVADVVLQVLQGRHLLAVLISPGFMPTGANRHKEGLTVGGLVLQEFFNKRRLFLEVCIVSAAKLLPFPVELVRQPLDEQHPKDELLELGSVHLAAQDVRSLQEEGLKLREGYLFGVQYILVHWSYIVAESIFPRKLASAACASPAFLLSVA